MGKFRPFARALACLAGALAVVLASGTPAAAQTGNLVGQVVNAETLQPLAGVQVYIQGLDLGTATNQNGRYILSVPAGSHEVAFESLGFGTQTVTANVTADLATEINVSLREEALALDEIVVTGTAGGTQRRAIGNVVETVDAAAVLEVAPVTNVQTLLAQRTPGMIMLPSAGQVGTGSPIRIRGTTSMSLGNDPIVYIDGIRMDSNPRGGPGVRGGARVSRLNDLSPEDIESIEVIKGPSAATLYGTEASNGVIQIITKRGAVGEPRFDISVRSGANWLQNSAGRAGGDPNSCYNNPASLDALACANGLQWRRNANTGQLEGFNLVQQEIDAGRPPIFRTGLQQGYNLGLRGGTEDVRYYTSLSWDDDEGIVGYDFATRLNARVNLDLVLSEDVSLRTSTGYMQNRVRLAQNRGGFGAEPFSGIIWGFPSTIETPQRGFMVAPPEEWSKHTTRADNDRITTSLELGYNPAEWTTHRLSFGLDRGEAVDWVLIPRQPEGRSHFWGRRGLGLKDVARIANRFTTLDYSGSAFLDVRPGLRLTSSVGVQYYQRQTSIIEAEGSEFPAVPITTVSGGADRDSGENFTENITLGAYVQQQLDWNNRVFLTAAVRGDDNSAFGADFDAAVYPKFSATWVVTEEDFFDVGWIEQLRLRSAWGAAGQQPGTFDAARLYVPGVGFGDQPGLLPGSFGNPQLKPERGEELEYGFDLSLLGGRLELIFSRYDRTIKDAIVRRPVPTSTGFSGSQIVNLAEVKAWGNEVGVDFRAVEGPVFSWDISGQFATMNNEIQDLGGLSFVPAGGQQSHYEGYSIGAFFAKRVLSAQIDAGGFVTSAMCDGGTGVGGIDSGGSGVDCAGAPDVHWAPSTPTWQVGITNSFSINNLRLYARIEGNGGHWNFNSELRAAHNIGVTEAVICRCIPEVQARRQYENNTMGFHEGGFLRLREVGASHSIPGNLLTHIGASRGVISVSARNMAMLWTKAHGWGTWRDGRVMPPGGFGGRWSWDAELRSTGNIRADQQTVMPPFASFTANVRLSF